MVVYAVYASTIFKYCRETVGYDTQTAGIIMKMIDKQLALNVSDARRTYGMKQSELAAMARVSVRTIQRIEPSGRCNPDTRAAVIEVLKNLDESHLTRSSRGPFVISIMNEKGGVGRTTVCTHLAHHVANRGKRVLMLQVTDGGEIFQNWQESRFRDQKVQCCVATSPSLARVILSRLPDVDYVFVDGPRYSPELTQVLARLSNLIVVPLGPSGADIHGTEYFLFQISMVRHSNARVVFVVNNRSGFAVSRHERFLFQKLSREYATPFANSTLRYRPAYRHHANLRYTLRRGGTDRDVQRATRAAIGEIGGLWDELSSLTTDARTIQQQWRQLKQMAAAKLETEHEYWKSDPALYKTTLAS